MPGQRAEGQKLIPVPMTEKFISAIDRAFRKEGYSDRSKFIRAAVREKLVGLGYPIEVEETLPPDRLGKGGKQKGRYRISRSATALNDSNSKRTSDATTLAKRVEASYRPKRPKA